MTRKRTLVAVMCVIVFAYIAYGIFLYVQGLPLRLSLHICPPGVLPISEQAQTVNDSPQPLTQIPDCPTQPLDVKSELRTAPVIIFGWPLMILARTPLGAEVSRLYYILSTRSHEINPISSGKYEMLLEATSVDPDMVRITDIANLYSVEIPKNWRITHEGRIDQEQNSIVRLSWIGGESPDWHMETRDYIDASSHVANGAAIEIYAFNQDIGHAPSHIPMSNKLASSKKVVIGGKNWTLDRYEEYDPPYFEGGVILEGVITQNNVFYTFRFAYNPTTYPEGEDVFMRILNSIKFTN